MQRYKFSYSSLRAFLLTIFLYRMIVKFPIYPTINQVTFSTLTPKPKSIIYPCSAEKQNRRFNSRCMSSRWRIDSQPRLRVIDRRKSYRLGLRCGESLTRLDFRFLQIFCRSSTNFRVCVRISSNILLRSISLSQELMRQV